MNYASIAAGEVSRRAAEGVSLPTPLVPLTVVPMIDRLIRLFVANNAQSVSVIVNSQNKLTQQYLHELKKQLGIPLNIIVKTTAGSMHSLYELKDFLQDLPFCLTTVDTIFSEKEFSQYIHAFTTHTEIDGLMAVTDYIDDEKPLYVEVAEDLRITAFGDTRSESTKYISGGIYCLKPVALDILKQTMKSGMTRMRDFQRQLIAYGLSLKAFPFTKIIDVDHVEDIKKAEHMLK